MNCCFVSISNDQKAPPPYNCAFILNSALEAPFDSQKTKKDAFSSRLGFILSTAGSAIGLANIWKFPYIVGKFGGGAFIALYLIFLALIGIPAFISEVLIGKSTQKTPALAFQELSGTKSLFWKKTGTLTIWTGFLVSSFYSVIAGWILGYSFQAVMGRLSDIHDIPSAHTHYITLMGDPLWTTFFHALFMGMCLWFLLGGIKKGIEFCNKLFMPLFFLILFIIAGYALRLDTADSVLSFMTSLDFTSIPPQAVIIALGHAFFTLSVGQGTLVTYGSYLKPKEKMLSSSVYVIVADTLVSLLAAFCILSIVFSANMEMEFGPGLIFETLPTIFSKITFGSAFSVLFFSLVFIAALTSQVSALEPLISHLAQNSQLQRKKAVWIVTSASFLLGVPSALSMNVLSTYTFFNLSYLEVMNFITTSILIPLGGFAAVILVGWRWGIFKALKALHLHQRTLRAYFMITIKFTAPILIAFVFLHALGLI